MAWLNVLLPDSLGPWTTVSPGPISIGLLLKAPYDVSSRR